MTNVSAFSLVSNVLASQQLRQVMADIVTFFQSCAVPFVEVSFGFGCRWERTNANKCDKSEYVKVPVDALPGFLQKSEDEGIWVLGEADLSISSSSIDVEFLLCHESDVHLWTGDEHLFKLLEEKWRANGYVMRVDMAMLSP